MVAVSINVNRPPSKPSLLDKRFMIIRFITILSKSKVQEFGITEYFRFRLLCWRCILIRKISYKICLPPQYPNRHRVPNDFMALTFFSILEISYPKQIKREKECQKKNRISLYSRTILFGFKLFVFWV